MTLSLDPGTHTGYALWDKGKLVGHGVLFIDWSSPHCIDNFVIHLKALLLEVSQCYCEKEYTFFPNMRSKIYLSRYHKAIATIQTTLSILGVPTEYCDTRGMAKKKQAQSIVRMLLSEKRNRSTHEAEAILLGMLKQGIKELR